MTTEYTTHNLDETLAFAQNIGKQLSGGEVIELVSDLGGGKTSFTKGLVQGAGSKDIAKSPSFTIENEYKTKDLIIHHLDFYRLEDPGIMTNMIEELINDPKAVTVIEWAGIVENILPVRKIRIEIVALEENERIFKINYPESQSYLLNLTS